jgi:hypothetical protein
LLVDKFHEINAKKGANNDRPEIKTSEKPFVL